MFVLFALLQRDAAARSQRSRQWPLAYLQVITESRWTLSILNVTCSVRELPWGAASWDISLPAFDVVLAADVVYRHHPDTCMPFDLPTLEHTVMLFAGKILPRF